MQSFGGCVKSSSENVHNMHKRNSWLIKLLDNILQLDYERDSATSGSLSILQKLSEHLFIKEHLWTNSSVNDKFNK